ncbi:MULTISPECIES: hypothetical protein [Streptomyces]|uniref:hypothetical protein n=1 Tax=Streptomyces TaxID=1883 RepID=UPI0004CDB5F8|nr:MULTISPECIES: hypothetical protein [Streptomyces]
MTDSPTEVAVELERLRAAVEVGLARVDGSLALLVQRSDQTEQRLADQEQRLDAVERGETDRQRRTEQRLDALERGRWPLPSVAALVALCGLILSMWQLVK